jgi:hypothetical protein
MGGGKHKPRFMQVFPTALNAHFMGHESDGKIRLSVSGQIRDDEKWCDLYRHDAWHHDSSTLPIHI